MNKSVILKKLLNLNNKLDENLNLVTKEHIKKWSPNTVFWILDDCELESLLSKSSESVVLEVYQLNDILENLKEQIGDFSINQAIESIVFYLENDAFADFKS